MLRLSTRFPITSSVPAASDCARPCFLLIARALGYSGEKHVDLAVVIEFIHTATLLHDDVVDESDLRRGRSTANSMFGNAASVLVGDFLYSRSFQMMVEAGNAARHAHHGGCDQSDCRGRSAAIAERPRSVGERRQVFRRRRAQDGDLVRGGRPHRRGHRRSGRHGRESVRHLRRCARQSFSDHR